MKFLLLGLTLLTSLSVFSAEVVGIYGYDQYRAIGQHVQPNSAVILYSDNTFELLRKYSDELKTSVQTGEYTISSGSITVSVQDSSCDEESKKGALGDFTLNYSEQSIFLDNVISYDKKEESFLVKFDLENTGCLL